MTDPRTDCRSYDAFARTWHADVLEEHTLSLEEARKKGLLAEETSQLIWQLLGELDDEVVLIGIPEWLADEKLGFVDGAIPTTFVVTSRKKPTRQSVSPTLLQSSHC